ncbi:hypothetical protein IFM89_031271 [Coptis chinensis]|uniref:Zinc finger C2HC5-type domain-containing protein n=1 Tax=Coptis chinensis TaxID=261450 RepID=A0A835IZA9_9MAGN|nr:hypothetical protein IFM89_031271 [Coptis chinensis]
MNPEKSGQWLEKALLNLCKNKQTGIQLDADIISGLVSYCELAPPEDAQEYLNNIVGQEAGQSVIEEYMRRRGVTAISNNANAPTSNMQAYIKPHQDYGFTTAPKKQPKIPREPSGSNSQANKIPSEAAESRNSQRGNTASSKKKKSGKVVSLAEAAKGTVVYKQGEPCSCQARRHRLVSNCLSCGKIVCEQEGEGPCSFCGALVLREGSTYAGLDETALPLSQTEVAAEAFAKRLVEYDRNSAARTTVIDDQSDYYELDGNKWLSAGEKDLLKKKQKEIEEADQARRSKVVVTFDLLGRKVMLNEDEASEIGSESRILRPLDVKEVNRIKPNPTLNVQPVYVDVGRGRERSQSKRPTNGLCLEITGRVQRDGSELQQSMAVGLQSTDSDGHPWQRPTVKDGLHVKDDYECSLDYN